MKKYFRIINNCNRNFESSQAKKVIINYVFGIFYTMLSKFGSIENNNKLFQKFSSIIVFIRYQS